MALEPKTLGEILQNIDDYDEFRPIFLNAQHPMTPASECLIAMGNDPAFGDFDYIPPEAQAKGMTRFLSSGQIMDVEGALMYQNEDYTQADLLAAVAAFYREHVAA